MGETGSGVGRPRQFDERRIVEAAVDLFWRHGFAATTTRMLEAELGMSQSSIYNTFGSKADLMDAALDHYEARLEAELVRPLLARGGVQALDRFVGSLVGWVHQHDRLGCMLLNALADSAPDERIVIRAARYRDRLRELFSSSFIAAGFDEREAAERAEALLAGVLGINIVARGGADRAELDGLATGLRRQLIAA
jgi:TetR/AcrR family transcriptional repressor of nem operon